MQWPKKHGKGYQTRINAVLRSYMEAPPNNVWKPRSARCPCQVHASRAIDSSSLLTRFLRTRLRSFGLRLS